HEDRRDGAGRLVRGVRNAAGVWLHGHGLAGPRIQPRRQGIPSHVGATLAGIRGRRGTTRRGDGAMSDEAIYDACAVRLGQFAAQFSPALPVAYPNVGAPGGGPFVPPSAGRWLELIW